MEEVKIGDQFWMAENLNVDKFRNGDTIPEAKTEEEWIEAGENGQPAWCYYNNNPENGDHYGKLYNWYAVNDLRGLAPEGWRVPTQEEILDVSKETNNAKSFFDIDDDMKRLNDELKDAGFKGDISNIHKKFYLPEAGRRDDKSGEFLFKDEVGYYWSSESCPNNVNFAKFINVEGEHVGTLSVFRSRGFSVRCIKD